MLRVDLFPARVTTPTVRWSPARVWITDDRVIVHHQDGPKAVLVADEPIASYDHAGRLATVVTASGQTWVCERRGGCGCGSPLKRLSFDSYTPATVDA